MCKKFGRSEKTKNSALLVVFLSSIMSVEFTFCLLSYADQEEYQRRQDEITTNVTYVTEVGDGLIETTESKLLSESKRVKATWVDENDGYSVSYYITQNYKRITTISADTGRV